MTFLIFYKIKIKTEFNFPQSSESTLTGLLRVSNRTRCLDPPDSEVTVPDVWTRQQTETRSLWNVHPEPEADCLDWFLSCLCERFCCPISWAAFNLCGVPTGPRSGTLSEPADNLSELLCELHVKSFRQLIRCRYNSAPDSEGPVRGSRPLGQSQVLQVWLGGAGLVGVPLRFLETRDNHNRPEQVRGSSKWCLSGFGSVWWFLPSSAQLNNWTGTQKEFCCWTLTTPVGMETPLQYQYQCGGL